MDIDAMEVGREMDALVAEKVMGKKYYRAEHKFFTGRFIHKELPIDPWNQRELEKGNYGEWEFEGPYYSTNISMALGVIGKIHSMSDEIQEKFISQLYILTNNTVPISRLLFYITPEAICRAALKAVLKC